MQNLTFEDMFEVSLNMVIFKFYKFGKITFIGVNSSSKLETNIVMEYPDLIPINMRPIIDINFKPSANPINNKDCEITLKPNGTIKLNIKPGTFTYGQTSYPTN